MTQYWEASLRLHTKCLSLPRLTPSSIIYVLWAFTMGERYAALRGRHASWVSNLNRQVEQKHRKGQACSRDSLDFPRLQLSDDEPQGKIQQMGWSIREHRVSCPSRSQRRTSGVCSNLSLFFICQRDGKLCNVVNHHDAFHLQIHDVLGSICYFCYLGQRLALL